MGADPVQGWAVLDEALGVGGAALGPQICVRTTIHPTRAPIVTQENVMTEVWSQEYWAKKRSVKLYMLRKRLGAPVAEEPPRPVLFLVHGSSFGNTVPTGTYLDMCAHLPVVDPRKIRCPSSSFAGSTTGSPPRRT